MSSFFEKKISFKINHLHFFLIFFLIFLSNPVNIDVNYRSQMRIYWILSCMKDRTIEENDDDMPELHHLPVGGCEVQTDRLYQLISLTSSSGNVNT
jgi:hypothetical protein